MDNAGRKITKPRSSSLRPGRSIGTDTGGSIRLPAAYNGIIGFKPSYGIISRFGVVPYANSLDTVGIMGKRVPHVKQVFRTYDKRTLDINGS